MRVYAISDLHLPGDCEKPMDRFGAHWQNHFDRIGQDWRGRVTDEDVVLIPGDTSWALRMEGALGDLRDIGALPGHKVLLRGNHDYWWGSITKVRAALPERMYALQNDAILLGGVVFCGTRGWVCPNGQEFTAEDERIYQREVMRLELTLSDARRLSEDSGGARTIAMMHYPPFNEKQEPSGFTRLFEQAGIADVLYGHLHGLSLRTAYRGGLRGVRYHQVSCDGLGFRLYEVD